MQLCLRNQVFDKITVFQKPGLVRASVLLFVWSLQCFVSYNLNKVKRKMFPFSTEKGLLPYLPFFSF